MPLTPKCHMLQHALEFAEEHNFLGKFDEATLESYHAKSWYIESHNNNNMAKNDAERLRRTLAHFSLIAVEPFLDQ